MRWTVLIPAKALPGAKSRLASMSADADAHRRLVEAIRRDTISAASAADGVARVVLVVDEGPAGPERLVQHSPGLDGAVRDGADHAAVEWPGDGVAALVGDLPALRPDELAAALRAAAEVGTGFVPDAEGTGTTMLTAVPARRLRPRFGAGSAARHATRATALPAGPGLRRDIDTADDLRAAAAELGVGPATAAVLDDMGVTVGGAHLTGRSTGPGMIGR